MHGLLRATAEAAAGEDRLQVDLVHPDAENLGDRGVIGGGKLAAEPRRRRVTVPLHKCVERLHRRVGEVREIVCGAQYASGVGKRGIGIALLARDHAGRFCELVVPRENLIGPKLERARLVPLDV